MDPYHEYTVPQEEPSASQWASHPQPPNNSHHQQQYQQQQQPRHAHRPTTIVEAKWTSTPNGYRETITHRYVDRAPRRRAVVSQERRHEDTRQRAYDPPESYHDREDHRRQPEYGYPHDEHYNYDYAQRGGYHQEQHPSRQPSAPQYAPHSHSQHAYSQQHTQPPPPQHYAPPPQQRQSHYTQPLPRRYVQPPEYAPSPEYAPPSPTQYAPAPRQYSQQPLPERYPQPLPERYPQPPQEHYSRPLQEHHSQPPQERYSHHSQEYHSQPPREQYSRPPREHYSEPSHDYYSRPSREYSEPRHDYYSRPSREYQEPRHEYSDPRHEYSQPPREYPQHPREYSEFPHQYSQPPHEHSQPPRECSHPQPSQRHVVSPIHGQRRQASPPTPFYHDSSPNYPTYPPRRNSPQDLWSMSELEDGLQRMCEVPTSTVSVESYHESTEGEARDNDASGPIHGRARIQHSGGSLSRMRYVGASSPSDTNMEPSPPRPQNYLTYGYATPIPGPSDSRRTESNAGSGQPQDVDHSVYIDPAETRVQMRQNNDNSLSHSDANSEHYVRSDNAPSVIEDVGSDILPNTTKSPASEAPHVPDECGGSEEPISHSTEALESRTSNVDDDTTKPKKKVTKRLVNRARRDSQDSETGILEAMRLDMKANGVEMQPRRQEKKLYSAIGVPRHLKFIAMRDAQALDRDCQLVQSSTQKWHKESTKHWSEMQKHSEIEDYLNSCETNAWWEVHLQDQPLKPPASASGW